MVKFDADITDPPGVDTSSPGRTIKNWAGYAVVAGIGIALLAVGQETVSPVVANFLEMLPGVSAGGEDDEIRVV